MDEHVTDRDSQPPGSQRSRAAGAGVAVVAAAALVVGGVAIARSPGTTRGAVLVSSQAAALARGATISVTGSGTVTGTPNVVSFDVGIQTMAGSATAALHQNNAKVAQLEATLARSGVRPGEMQTSSLDIWDNTNSKGRVTSFSVSDTLSVQMTGVASAGTAIDAAAGAAGNGIQFDGVSFSFSNESKLLARARAAAMLNARTEASEDAAGAGLSLGPVVRVVDEENAASNVIYPQNFSVPVDASPLHLAAGHQPVSVQVHVVYELRS